MKGEIRSKSPAWACAGSTNISETAIHAPVFTIIEEE